MRKLLFTALFILPFLSVKAQIALPGDTLGIKVDSMSEKGIAKEFNKAGIALDRYANKVNTGEGLQIGGGVLTLIGLGAFAAGSQSSGPLVVSGIGMGLNSIGFLIKSGAEKHLNQASKHLKRGGAGIKLNIPIK